MSELIKTIQRRLVAANLAEVICHKFIDWYDGLDVLSKVEAMFGGGPILADNPGAFDLLSELILYDMLRSYVRGYFFVHVSGQ